jgi:hypothetical protein
MNVSETTNIQLLLQEIATPQWKIYIRRSLPWIQGILCTWCASDVFFAIHIRFYSLVIGAKKWLISFLI